MDPLSHVAFGRLLGALTGPQVLRARSPSSAPATGMPAAPDVETLTRRRAARGLTAAYLLGSLSPDIDVVLMPHWDRYLVLHEYATHSFVGTVLPAVLTALVILAVVRRRGARFRHLFLGAWIGAVGHVVLDVASGGTSRWLWPLSDVRVTGALVAMADPIYAVPLGLFLIASICWRRAAPRLARATLAILLALSAVKAVSYIAALRTVAAHVDAGDGAVLEAHWGSFRDWRLFDRQGDDLRAWRIRAWPQEAVLRFTKPVAPTTPAIAASKRLQSVQRFRELFHLGFPTETREDGWTTVLWSDIRFCGPASCDLWFGGALDPSLRPIEEIVLVGEWRQTRARGLPD